MPAGHPPSHPHAIRPKAAGTARRGWLAPGPGRWLLVVLMFLLPAQFSWAAAAPYCAHESNPPSFHIGHHAHGHQGSQPGSQPAAQMASLASAASLADGAQGVAAEPDAPRGSPVADHADCSYCHGVAGQFATAATPRFGPVVRQAPLPATVAASASGRPDSIDRPRWDRAL